MSTKKIEVKTFKEIYLCNACGCNAVKFEGITLTSDPPQYPHKCQKCGESINLRKLYPDVVYEEVEHTNDCVNTPKQQNIEQQLKNIYEYVNVSLMGRDCNSSNIQKYLEEINRKLDRLINSKEEHNNNSCTQIRKSVMDFACGMEQKLRDKDYKGGWINCKLEDLLEKLKEEVVELEEVLFYEENTKLNSNISQYPLVNFGTQLKIDAAMKECVDVGNFAMMLYDILNKELNKHRNVK